MVALELTICSLFVHRVGECWSQFSLRHLKEAFCVLGAKSHRLFGLRLVSWCVLQ